MKDKPAIGILMRALVMGGAEKQSLLQAKLMSDEFDVYFIVQKKRDQIKQHLDFIEKEKINYIQLSGNIISRTKQLIACIKRNRIKVLFSFLPLDNLLASIVSVIQEIKYVGGVRSSHLPFVKFYANWIIQKYFLDYMIFNNYAGRDIFIKKGFLSSKSVVIQNCINNIHKEIIRPDRKKIRILSVGRFTAEKDYLTALKTILLLKRMVFEQEIEYIIVGDGELDLQIQSWIKDLQVSNVTIVRNPDKIEDYYIDADIYFLSSLIEGMPNSIMEAFSYSLPVVSTDAGDAKYLVKDGINGFLVPVKDSVALAEKLLELVTDSDKRNTFGINGRNLMMKEFSEKKYQEEYVNFTKKIMQINGN
jgi:glycosyltransferase involved in cell wall biosynthesis